MKKTIFRVCLASIMLIAFQACSDIDDGDSLVLEQSNSVPVYENGQNMIEQANATLSMSTDDLKSLEELRGFKSFGQIADEVYDVAFNKGFSSLNELEAYVELNSEYLLLIKNEEDGSVTVETQLYDNPFRYLINSDRMYQVGDILLKETPNGRANTSLNNLEFLKDFEGDPTKTTSNKQIVFDKKETNTSLLATSSSQTRLDYAFGKQRNGGQKTEMVLNTFRYLENGTEDVAVLYQVKPWKWIGFWWNVSRTIRGYVNLNMRYNTGSGWQRASYTNEIEGHHADSWGGVFIAEENVGSITEIQFASYFAFGDTPSTNTVVLERNKFDACASPLGLLFGYVCPDPDPDPCAGVSCPIGYTCENGNCIDQCSGVFCSQGYSCQNGQCVQDDSTLCNLQNPCPQGEQCVDGICRPW